VGEVRQVKGQGQGHTVTNLHTANPTDNIGLLLTSVAFSFTFGERLNAIHVISYFILRGKTHLLFTVAYVRSPWRFLSNKARPAALTLSIFVEKTAISKSRFEFS